MSYRAGESVSVRSLKRAGVVLEVLKPGLYRVEVGGMTVQCREDELTDAPQKKKKRAARGASKRHRPTTSGESAPPTIDLHGLIVLDALQAMELAINRGIGAGDSGLRVMHGLGTGKVKSAVHAYLSQATFIRSFRVDPSNPGVTEVYY
jgi:DNA mismatch repair protein MutS2